MDTKPSSLENQSEIAFLAEPKRSRLPDPKLRCAIERRKDPDTGMEYLVATIEATAGPAFFVAPEFQGWIDGGRFEDSGFHLQKGERRSVRYLAGNNATRPAEAGLVVRHLRGSYD